MKKKIYIRNKLWTVPNSCYPILYARNFVTTNKIKQTSQDFAYLLEFQLKIERSEEHRSELQSR